MASKVRDHNPDPPNAELIEALEVYGYKVDSVKRWTTTKAMAELDQRRKADAIAARRRQDVAAPKRGYPLPMMRTLHAKYLAEPMSAEDLTGAVVSCIYQLDDSELKRLGGYLGKLLAADDGRCPAQLLDLAAKAGGDRGEAEAEPEDTTAGVDPAEGRGPESGVRQAGAGVREDAGGTAGPRRPSLPGL